MDLGFDYGDLASKVVVSRFSLIRGFGDAVFKNFDAKLAEYLLALYSWIFIYLRSLGWEFDFAGFRQSKIIGNLDFTGQQDQNGLLAQH